ncbi:MAG: ABC transporter substrate-binding protein [Geobacter sp.]|nr:ABC transporter substrate-binding protein [Geobacter sp.]
MIRTGLAVVAIFLPLCLATAVNAETVTVAGSSGMIPLLKELGAAYMKKNPHDEIKVSSSSLTQSGGILAAKNGAVDIGMSARDLETRELSYSIDDYHIANVAATVAVHSNVGITNITAKQLCAIYSGKLTNWKELGGHNARIVVYTRPESDSTKQAFRKGIPCFGDLQETPEAISMNHSTDILSALKLTDDSVGIIDAIALEQARGRAKPLRLDGRRASAEEVANGHWPVIKRYNLIVGTKRKKAVDRFMRFIKSREGAAVISRHAGMPINFTYP